MEVGRQGQGGSRFGVLAEQDVEGGTESGFEREHSRVVQGITVRRPERKGVEQASARGVEERGKRVETCSLAMVPVSTTARRAVLGITIKGIVIGRSQDDMVVLEGQVVRDSAMRNVDGNTRNQQERRKSEKRPRELSEKEHKQVKDDRLVQYEKHRELEVMVIDKESGLEEGSST